MLLAKIDSRKVSQLQAKNEKCRRISEIKLIKVRLIKRPRKNKPKRLIKRPRKVQLQGKNKPKLKWIYLNRPKNKIEKRKSNCEKIIFDDRSSRLKQLMTKLLMTKLLIHKIKRSEKKQKKSKLKLKTRTLRKILKERMVKHLLILEKKKILQISLLHEQVKIPLKPNLKRIKEYLVLKR